MRRIYFDTEFTGLHQRTKLISIGMVTEDDQEFYAEFNDFHDGFVSDDDLNFFINKLRPNLSRHRPDLKPDALGDSSEEVKKSLESWLIDVLAGHPAQMWSDCLSYDWMLFCQLWGHALKIPPYIYYIPMDLCTLLLHKGVDPDINREEFAGVESSSSKHNSLHDARIIKLCVEKAEAL